MNRQPIAAYYYGLDASVLIYSIEYDDMNGWCIVEASFNQIGNVLERISKHRTYETPSGREYFRFRKIGRVYLDECMRTNYPNIGNNNA